MLEKSTPVSKAAPRANPSGRLQAADMRLGVAVPQGFENGHRQALAQGRQNHETGLAQQLLFLLPIDRTEESDGGIGEGGEPGLQSRDMRRLAQPAMASR